jgi:hypothetical protein
VAIKPSKEPARNGAEKRAKFDEYFARKSGGSAADQRRASNNARRLERKFGLNGKK